MYLLAYYNIYAKEGNMTEGTDGETIDGMSLQRIRELIAKIKDESYQPQPSRRTYILKKDGKRKRPLGIPAFKDKLLQEVIKMILESIYEGSFANCSHGFRPDRSCHTALTKVKAQFPGMRWFVEGDIKGCFDNISHDWIMNNIPMEHTIELMKNKNQLQQKVVEFIKNADLYMDNFEYVDMDKIQLKTGEGDERPDEKVLDIPENIMDQIRLVSTYKGVHVPSMIFDSTGTKKIAAIASYVIEALEQGRILVVDELDSSIHFKLTRAIVAMFNNELNTSAQMIFTVHDINLMDCKRMFRKEQIWFVHKDEEGVYVYSLADFTAQQGVRDTTDVMEKYRKGALGALPDPELINSLLNLHYLRRQ